MMKVTASSLLGEGRERGVGGVENLRPLSTGNRPSSVSLSAMVRSGLAWPGLDYITASVPRRGIEPVQQSSGIPTTLRPADHDPTIPTSRESM